MNTDEQGWRGERVRDRGTKVLRAKGTKGLRDGGVGDGSAGDWVPGAEKKRGLVRPPPVSGDRRAVQGQLGGDGRMGPYWGGVWEDVVDLAADAQVVTVAAMTDTWRVGPRSTSHIHGTQPRALPTSG